MLVPLKILYLANLWPKMACMLIFGHVTYFYYNSKPFLDQLDWNFLWELRRLLSIDCWWEIQVMILIFHFWATLCGKIAVVTTRPPNGLGIKTRPKRWTFWANHYLEIVFSKFSDCYWCLIGENGRNFLQNENILFIAEVILYIMVLWANKECDVRITRRQPILYFNFLIANDAYFRFSSYYNNCTI